MSKTFRHYEPDQMLLMPASLREWLAPDHLAHFISDMVDTLDLSAISGRYEGEGVVVRLLHRGALLQEDREAP